MSEPATTHSLERTSPMGGPFVGRCVLCGALGLPSGAALWRCDNPARKSMEQALIDAIERPATTSQEEEQ